MSIIGGALIGGAANILGNIIGNSSAKSEASRNRQFQEKMAKNAHQYQVADLKAAGLNPILSAGGSGASTPSGSQANINVPNLDLTKFASSAADTILKNKQQDLLDAQVDNVQAQTANTEAQTTATNLENSINQSSKGIKSDLWQSAHDAFKWGKQGVTDMVDEFNNNSAKAQPKINTRMHIKTKKMANGVDAVYTPEGYYLDGRGNKYNKLGKLIK